MTKDAVLQVRCTTEQKRWYEQAAADSGRRLSSWVLATLDNEVQQVDQAAPPPAEEDRPETIGQQVERVKTIQPVPQPFEPEDDQLSLPRVRTHQFKPDFKKGGSR